MSRFVLQGGPIVHGSTLRALVGWFTTVLETPRQRGRSSRESVTRLGGCGIDVEPAVVGDPSKVAHPGRGTVGVQGLE